MLQQSVQLLTTNHAVTLKPVNQLAGFGCGCFIPRTRRAGCGGFLHVHALDDLALSFVALLLLGSLLLLRNSTVHRCDRCLHLRAGLRLLGSLPLSVSLQILSLFAVRWVVNDVAFNCEHGHNAIADALPVARSIAELP